MQEENIFPYFIHSICGVNVNSGK